VSDKELPRVKAPFDSRVLSSLRLSEWVLP